MNGLLNFFKKDDIGEPPWEYDFLINIDESDYPKYLKKIYKYRTDGNLPLKYDFKDKKFIIDKKRCKTFNEKIQWLKLYDATPLKRDCTDKVKARDYVKERIGDEFLKPVLQVCNSFDKVNFEELPNEFVIKYNHGCKWHYIISDKEELLTNKDLYDSVKRQMIGWGEQEFWPWEGFEMQYKGIEPKIIVEPFMIDEDGQSCKEIEVYCFNGEVKFLLKVRYRQKREISYYDADLNHIDLILHPDGKNKILNEEADVFVKQARDLSKKLAGNFKLVRVDWMIYRNKLYFEEMTFTPYSGFIPFDKNWEKKIGNYIEL